MKALVNTGVETLTYMDQADPIAKAGEEMVRIQYSGICGSDMHAFLGHDARRPTPIILGHEASGSPFRAKIFWWCHGRSFCNRRL